MTSHAFQGVKEFTGTWLGRPGTSTVHHLTKSEIGPRVDVHRWHDTGEVVVRGIDGDAWRGRRPFREVFHRGLSAHEATLDAVSAAVMQARGALRAEGVWDGSLP